MNQNRKNIRSFAREFRKDMAKKTPLQFRTTCSVMSNPFQLPHMMSTQHSSRPLDGGDD